MIHSLEEKAVCTRKQKYPVNLPLWVYRVRNEDGENKDCPVTKQHQQASAKPTEDMSGSIKTLD